MSDPAQGTRPGAGPDEAPPPEERVAHRAQPVALVATGVGLPSCRLRLADLAATWGGSTKGELAVCDADEDTLTLAWAAGTAALRAAGLSPREVDGLWWGTSRPPFAEGPSHSFLATALGLPSTCGGLIASGSPSAGMDALFAAWDAVAASHAGLALVVTSDALVPGTGTATEAATGAGAAAFLIASSGRAAGTNPPPAWITTRATLFMPALDRYRADASPATSDAYDPRLFREEVFVPLVSEVGRRLADPSHPGDALSRAASSVTTSGDGQREAAGQRPDTFGCSIADPDGKLAAGIARRLGGDLVSASSRQAIGDTGAASAFLGALGALSRPGELAVISYGGGRASGIKIEISQPVPGSPEAAAVLGAAGESGRQVTSYTGLLRARGQLDATGDPVAMGVPPGSAAFVRGNEEMLALQGARCRECGTISTPPSVHPTCTGCGGSALETVALGRSGVVETFVVNHTMPSPFQAPLPLVVVDLDGGGRLMLQGSSHDAGALAIGDRVHLVLRRYALERGVAVYGYKALRDGSGMPPGATLAASGATGTA